MNRYIFLLLFFLGSYAYAQKITRVPYLQKPTSTSMTIRWRTDESVKGKIIYRKENTNDWLSTEEKVAVFNHEIELTNLQPNSHYQYQVATDTKVLDQSAALHFKTLATKENPQPIRIWAMGDFGDFTKKAYIDNQNAVYASFKKFNQDKEIDLWMWLGDNAYCCGLDNQYQTGVFEYFSRDFFAKTPFVSVPGNHEYYFAEGSEKTRQIPYFDIISTHTKGEGGGVPSGNKAFYSFDIGNIHFISLDSYGLDDGKKLYNWESPQYQWLLKDLEENSKKNNMWTVVYVHHPPYTKRSHDSDFEQDLVQVRAFLVHIFDQYKVDLVLSGHSHVYERSYLIKNHRQGSDTFNPEEHIVQKTKALYTADSPPIINKEEGTIYAVVGSAGRLDWNGKNDPHPTSVYANKDLGGSLLLTIDNNRLDGQWMCADGTIKDNFTVFKNVNNTQTIEASNGEEVELQASWPGRFYRWNNANAGNLRTQKIKVSTDITYTVTDSLGYLKDTFVIKVVAKPTIKPILEKNKPICSGSSVAGNMEITNGNLTGKTYKILLSDENGNFENATVLGQFQDLKFSVTLPENLSTSGNYLLKAEIAQFESLVSEAFTVSKPATAQITSDGRIPFSPETSLKVNVTGSLPAVLKVSNLTEIDVNSQEVTVTITPKGGEKYSIEYVKNVCGLGKTLGSEVIIESPLGTEKGLNNVKVFPNPGNGNFEIESPSTSSKPSQLEIIDVSGKVIFRKKLYHPKEQLELLNLANGLYIFKVSQNEKSVTLKVLKQ